MASPPLPAISVQPPEESPRGVLSLVLLFVLPAAIFAALVAYAQLERTNTTPQQGTPGALVWGEGKVIFSNKQQLAAWLRLHGSSYSTFVKRHPEALRLVTARPRKTAPGPTSTTHVAAAARPAAKPKPVKTVTITTSTASKTAAGSGTGKTSPRAVVLSIAAALGLLLAAFAVLPPSVIRRIGIRSSLDRQRELRYSAVAMSVAIFAGVGFGALVG